MHYSPSDGELRVASSGGAIHGIRYGLSNLHAGLESLKKQKAILFKKGFCTEAKNVPVKRGWALLNHKTDVRWARVRGEEFRQSR